MTLTATQKAVKAIRCALRAKGCKAEIHTRIGTFSTTKQSIVDLLPTLGEVTYTSKRGGYWTFTDENEGFDTAVSADDKLVSFDC